MDKLKILDTQYAPFFKGNPTNVNHWTTTWFRGITPTQARTLFANGLVTSIDDFLNRYLI